MSSSNSLGCGDPDHRNWLRPLPSERQPCVGGSPLSLSRSKRARTCEVILPFSRYLSTLAFLFYSLKMSASLGWERGFSVPHRSRLSSVFTQAPAPAGSSAHPNSFLLPLDCGDLKEKSPAKSRHRFTASELSRVPFFLRKH